MLFHSLVSSLIRDTVDHCSVFRHLPCSYEYHFVCFSVTYILVDVMMICDTCTGNAIPWKIRIVAAIGNFMFFGELSCWEALMIHLMSCAIHYHSRYLGCLDGVFDVESVCWYLRYSPAYSDDHSVLPMVMMCHLLWKICVLCSKFLCRVLFRSIFSDTVVLSHHYWSIILMTEIWCVYWLKYSNIYLILILISIW